MEKENIQKAILMLNTQLIKRFKKNIELYIFGSVARGEYSNESDIDVLVLIPFKLTNSIEEEIFNIAYDIELKYSIIFGIIVYSKDFWFSSITRNMPLYRNIKKEGIPVWNIDKI
ncbi:MAG: nucleotidyltransferase domain-containing protein [Cyanobacteria bacterium]|nr:nucleotidyltransferase domain-containing protein [Cyanobacteriota bacterium]